MNRKLFLSTILGLVLTTGGMYAQMTDSDASVNSNAATTSSGEFMQGPAMHNPADMPQSTTTIQTTAPSVTPSAPTGEFMNAPVNTDASNATATPAENDATHVDSATKEFRHSASDVNVNIQDHGNGPDVRHDFFFGTNRDFHNQVREVIVADPAMAPFADSIDAVNCNGNLVLFGVVNDDALKAKIENRVKALQGVNNVQNKIMVNKTAVAH